VDAKALQIKGWLAHFQELLKQSPRDAELWSFDSSLFAGGCSSELLLALSPLWVVSIICSC
jgi:hypothetical protein